MDDSNQSEPITTYDLFPKSKPADLEYEETPVIKPIPPGAAKPLALEHTLDNEKDLPKAPTAAELPDVNDLPKGEPPKPHPNWLWFVILFLVGIGLSYLLKPFLNNLMPNSQPTPRPIPTTQPTSADQSGQNEASVSGTSKYSLTDLGFPDISFALPSDLNPLTCDSSACQSKGTYLPGGTRFTVYTQKLTASDNDFPKTVVTDAAGRAFPTIPSTINGLPALTFAGNFSGVTSGGYAFNRMKGTLFLAAPNTGVGFNHFVPSGINADFASDDIVFNQIIDSLNFTK